MKFIKKLGNFLGFLFAPVRQGARPPAFLRRRGFWRFILLGLIAVFGALGLYLVILLRSLPSPELIQNREVAQSTKIFDRTGEVLLYELFEEEKRTIVPFAEIPNYVKWATIAIEDDRFYEHGAVDLGGIVRAMFVNLKSGRVVQGGSTITQQLAKKAFLTDERTIDRKLKELALSLRLENNFTKDQILELYLNQIPYGSNAYGIESAAQSFFQKTATELSLAEAALLASLPRAPSYYSPWGSHVDDLLARQKLTLERMRDLGYITEVEYAAAANEKLEFARPANLLSAPHFVIAIQEYLNEKYGEDFVRRAGLRVITTLDAGLQELAEAAVKAGAERNEELYKGKNAALLAQDAKTGQVLAMVGSRDYFNEEISGNFNVVTQGLRQPGSALKPFVYLEAFRRGYTPDTILFDLQTEFDTTKLPERSYRPHNFDEVFRGPISLRNALAQSINVPAVKTLYLVGIDNVLALLRSFGVQTLTERSRYGLSLVLGGGEVKLLELVGAYSVLAQDGIRHKQNFLLEVKDAAGQTLEEFKDAAEQVVESEPVRQINNILSDVNARSPLFSGSLNQTVFPGYEVAIKTGTTNDYRDAWAIGYTPTLVTGVWAGNSDNQPMERRGGSILAAIPILHSFLAEGLKTQPAEFFPKPEYITQAKPMLNGEYVANYQAGGATYPHIHNILHYVNRSDPTGAEPIRPEQDSQYENWEQAVLLWASANIPNFVAGVNYNQPLPINAVLPQNKTNTSSSSLEILEPKNGAFIGSNLTVHFKASLPERISRIEIFFNNSLIHSRVGLFEGSSIDYSTNFTVNELALQNILKVLVTDEQNNKKEKELVLYR